jgi:hypothetical protein
MRYLILCAALALAGCATPQERTARLQADMDRDIATYGPACARLGYTAGSDHWRACILQLSTKEELRNSTYPSSFYGGYGSGHWGGWSFWGSRW